MPGMVMAAAAAAAVTAAARPRLSGAVSLCRTGKLQLNAVVPSVRHDIVLNRYYLFWFVMLTSIAKEDFTGTVPSPLWVSHHVSHSISYVTQYALHIIYSC